MKMIKVTCWRGRGSKYINPKYIVGIYVDSDGTTCVDCLGNSNTYAVKESPEEINALLEAIE